MKLTSVLMVYLILNAVIWILRHISISRAARESESLDSKYPLANDNPKPRVSLLVAAKDEENNIGRCLKSLLNQDYPNLQIIVMNDRSTDSTKQIIDEIVSGTDRDITAIHIDHLPDGWNGKQHAMYKGMQQATGEYLLFTDADCFFQCPSAVSITLEYSKNNDIDLLSVLPVLQSESFWERILQPVCSAVLMIWFQPLKVNNPNNKIAYANGAFMLFKRSCYEAIGGHELVKNTICEDMDFARLVKKAGKKLYVIQNVDLYRTRMYENFRDTFRGWSRIFFGCFDKLQRVIAAIVMLLVMSLLPYFFLIILLVKAIINGLVLSEPASGVFVWSVIAITAQMSVLMRFYILTGSTWIRSLSYPVGAFITLGILLDSTTKFFTKKVVWRGSTIIRG